MSTEKIEVDSEKLKRFLDRWSGPPASRGTAETIAADILARNPHLSEVEVTVRMTRRGAEYAATHWTTMGVPSDSDPTRANYEAAKCTRCGGSGFLNTEQLPFTEAVGPEDILRWIKANDDHDVCVCDCCGNGESWYGVPGEHYNSDDQPGRDGPYAYNGGLCECH